MDNFTRSVKLGMLACLLMVFTNKGLALSNDELKTVMAPPPSYCSANGDNTNDEYIGRVQLNTIDNTSTTGTTSTGYSDFTGISTTLNPTSTYTLTVTAVWTGTTYSEAYRAWIDYNQDGDFTDPGEEVWSQSGTTTSPVSGNFTVPVTATTGNTRMRIAMRYNTLPDPCGNFNYGEVEDYTVTIGAVSIPEINLQGNAVTIADNDTTPSVADDTDFGNVDVTAATNANTFTIQNTGSANLNLTSGSPYVIIGGTHAADFTLTANPSSPIAASGNTTFTITFDPSATGLRTATVTIANNDSDENPYNFNIQGTGTNPFPEISVTGSGNNITDGDTTPTPFDDTDFGNVLETGGNNTNIYTIQNLGGTNLSLTGASPYVTVTGAHAADFTVTTIPTTPITSLNSTTFAITFDPSALGLRTATISIANNDSDENPFNFSVQGTGVTTLVQAPGGVTADLQLWLKGTDGLGYTDGQSVSLWEDQGNGADATVNTAGQEPTYRDNATKNVNFNPVVEFDNAYGTYVLDSDYSFDNTSTQFLEGTGGMYTQDIFLVMIPDDTVISNNFGFMDIFCGDENESSNQTDATGIGAGYYTDRFSGEIFCFAVGTTNSGDGYGVAEIGTGSVYNNVGIINARNNTAVTQQELYYNANNIGNTQNDLPDFSNVNDSRYWIGRSEGWEASTNARIAEIITFSSRKDDADLTQERNRIQSYLAVKYGITLGVNGTSQDYVDSDGTVIWDQSDNIGYNYDIAGIGRDDSSDLLQKQSSSVNNASDATGPTEGILTMGLTDIYDTNNININTNSNTLNNKQFLMWGNNGADLDLAAADITVNMSAGISPSLTTDVTFTAMQRIWKVNEVNGDVGRVKISIPQNSVRNIRPPGSYLMFISDTPIFDPTADYRIMSQTGGNLETEYDFNGTKYITFGYAPEVVVVRSVYFDGAVDYIEMEDEIDLNPTEFTVSAWVKRASGSANTSILSKRDAAYTEGYDFKINATGHFEMSWINGTTQSITSDVVIPVDEWHQVAVIYSGGQANLYIDGVLDKTATLSAPVATSRAFNIAAADGSTSLFEGNIDEVRVWNSALTTDQLHYIMNQEIEDNATFVNGRTLPLTITKNEVVSIPWSELEGYYPMSTFTYTNVNDESNNGHTGALRNLDTVDRQTAPLPYVSQADGAWTTDATWLNHDVQTLPNTLSIVDGTTPVNWNIVETHHNITINDNTTLGREREVLGLMVKSNEITVNGDTSSGTGNGLTVTHYLELDGSIDLEGESQLIQSEDSDLDVTSAGTLERDQQGTADLFTYNYWAAPVGISNTTSNNNSYTLPDVMNDGTNPASPAAVNWLTSGYNGTPGPPIGIADYWVWKFANQLSDDYPSWQHVRSTGSLQAGEGFTMKGTTDTGGAITTMQNYVFNGKPHNGDITLTLSAGNDYLIGNPYASAIDADQFILDNMNTGGGNAASDIINGTLYFWDHFASSTHILADYQGGYATYTLLGGTVAVSNDIRINNNGAVGTKVPGRYIPVGQAFFVTANTGGTISFKNEQRVFHTEASGNSQFMRNPKRNKKIASTRRSQNTDQDNRQKIWIMFDSPTGYHRQLLVGADPNCTYRYDVGYDAPLIEDHNEDMYWLIDDGKYVIQGVDEFNTNSQLPLGVKIHQNGSATFRIDSLENIPDDMDIYLYDSDLNSYTDLRNQNYDVTLAPGEHHSRFEIRFGIAGGQALHTNENDISQISTHFVNSTNSIIIKNPNNITIRSISMYNLLGQNIYSTNVHDNQKLIEQKLGNQIALGTYIIKLIDDHNNEISKKVLVN